MYGKLLLVVNTSIKDERLCVEGIIICKCSSTIYRFQFSNFNRVCNFSKCFVLFIVVQIRFYVFNIIQWCWTNVMLWKKKGWFEIYQKMYFSKFIKIQINVGVKFSHNKFHFYVITLFDIPWKINVNIYPKRNTI